MGTWIAAAVYRPDVPHVCRYDGAPFIAATCSCSAKQRTAGREALLHPHHTPILRVGVAWVSAKRFTLHASSRVESREKTPASYLVVRASCGWSHHQCRKK